jgi:hypothetical protein
VFLQSERLRCRYWSAYVAAAICDLVRTVRFVRLALKIVMQNNRDFVVVILLYVCVCQCVNDTSEDR